MKIKHKVMNQVESGHIVLWIRRVIGLIMLVSVAYTLFATWQSGLLPDKYVLPAVIGVGVVSLVSAFYLCRRGLGSIQSIIAILIASLILACSYVGYNVVNVADNFINSVSHGPSVRYETYGVVTLKDSKIDYYDTSGFQIGINSMDTYLEELRAELDRKSNAEVVEGENLTHLGTSLLAGEVGVITVNISHLDLINNNLEGFADSTHTVHTFKIRVEGDKPTSEIDGKNPFILYISGVDTYGNINTSSRSDVNMLAVINPITSSILLVNTPRDYYVELAGANGARDKLTHAGIYGVETSQATLENLYGINIDRHLKVNFTTLVNVVDSIGGITVKSDYPFKGFKVGDNHVNGRQALEFSRERYSFEEGDLQRGRNQQRVIEGIIARLSNPQTLLSYQDVLLSLQGSLQSNVEAKAIKNLINTQLSDMKSWSVESIGVEGHGGQDFTYSMGGLPLYVMYPDENSVYEARGAIARTLNRE